MGDAAWTLIIFAGVALFIYLITSGGRSESDQERERREKEHEIEMMRLDEERERLGEERSVPSGRGKVVKAKR